MIYGIDKSCILWLGSKKPSSANDNHTTFVSCGAVSFPVFSDFLNIAPVFFVSFEGLVKSCPIFANQRRWYQSFWSFFHVAKPVRWIIDSKARRQILFVRKFSIQSDFSVFLYTVSRSMVLKCVQTRKSIHSIWGALTLTLLQLYIDRCGFSILPHGIEN